MPIDLSRRERQTVLAALRCWLNELGYYNLAELANYYPEIGSNPLTVDEVDALLVRLAREEVTNADD